ncbi:MAG TPA: hypothetical protein VFK69_11035 [Candidatus Eisenbacteria bacterium]|nr:hypothetical protein [Candidatus Eisenbacteria bacterium]
MNGVEPIPLERPGPIARLFGRKPRANAYAEIRNRLAAAPVLALQRSDVDEVLARYQLARDAVRPRLLELYAMVMRHAARDAEITEDELRELAHLRRAFGLTEDDVRGVERDLLEDTFRAQLRLAIGDSRFTDEEKRRIREVARRLRIPDALAAAIREEEVRKVWDRVFDATIVDRRLSEEEERYLADLAANLGVHVQLDRATQRQLDHFRLLWRIEQGELPTLDTDVPLAPGERAHAVARAHRFCSTSPARPGGGRRVKLGRVTHWELEQSAGAGDAARWRPDGDGTLVVTAGRVLFAGGAAPDGIPMERIERFTVYRDGLGLEIERERDILFAIDGDTEILGTVLGVFVKGHPG